MRPVTCDRIGEGADAAGAVMRSGLDRFSARESA
jgi:hypothetical protein